MSQRPVRKGAVAVWAAFALLFVLHQDAWWWTDRTLVLGWLPIGLAWHTGFSIAAGLLWAAANRWAWPHDIEAWADAAPAGEAPTTGSDDPSRA